MQFLVHCETTLVHDWSRRRSVESYMHVPFETTLKLTLEDRTNSWQWSQRHKNIIRHKKDGRDVYCIPGGAEK